MVVNVGLSPVSFLASYGDQVCSPISYSYIVPPEGEQSQLKSIIGFVLGILPSLANAIDIFNKDVTLSGSPLTIT